MAEFVFVSIVLARLVVPLFIPRYPLPAIVASLVIDAADQSIFAAFGVEPGNYQSYDKALDIYYLSIAYISTIRNWIDGSAFRISQFLWYYRLIGVVAFELTHNRALLFIFPNTFEYFFIFYETVRLWWRPERLTARALIGVTAALWIGVKLPQEWWIHIAQLDFTDFVAENPWAAPVLILVALAAMSMIRHLQPRLPPADWTPHFDVDIHQSTVVHTRADAPTSRWAPINHPLVEKTLLVGLVTTIFWQLLPETDQTVLEITLGVGVIVMVNAWVSSWLARRGTSWAATGASFTGTAAINLAIVLGLRFFAGAQNADQLGGLLTLLQLGLLTLMGTLYDRFRKQRLTVPTFSWRYIPPPVES